MAEEKRPSQEHKLDNPVREHLDYKPFARAAKSDTELHDAAVALAAQYGFAAGVITGVVTVAGDDPATLVAEVGVDTTTFNDIPMLEGGGILAVFQALADQLPAKLGDRTLEWRFVDATKKGLTASLKKHAQLADTLEYQMAQSGVERLGEQVLNSNVPDVIVAYWATKMLIDKLGQHDPHEWDILLGKASVKTEAYLTGNESFGCVAGESCG